MRNFLLALAVGVIEAVLPSSFAEAASQLDSIEYKFPLARDLSNAATRKELGDLIAGDDGSGGAWDAKKCRLIQFLDTADRAIKHAGFILRHRAKLQTEDCSDEPSASKSGDLVLKLRSTRREAGEAAAAASWATGERGKFEEDVGYAIAQPTNEIRVGSAFSVSVEEEDADVPEAIRDLPKSFKQALTRVETKATLAPGCRRVVERRWVMEPPHDAQLPDELELVVWQRAGSRHASTAKPLLSELSFKAKLADTDAVIRADALASRLVRTFPPAWIATSGGKTETVYECE